MLWRETGRIAKVFGIDARVMILFLLFMVHVSMWTALLVLGSVLFFAVLAQFGYTFPNALRRLKVVLFFGNRRAAVPFWRKNKWK